MVRQRAPIIRRAKTCAKYLGDDINMQQNQAAMMISSKNAAMMISSQKIQSLDPAKAGEPTSERANSGITAWKILMRTSRSTSGRSELKHVRE